MKFKEQISIDEFDGKRFQVRLVEPSDDRKAILTHYLHNIHNGVSKHYKKDALKLLKDYVEYTNRRRKYFNGCRRCFATTTF
jgi:DNA (cytosine-5)-methyltransferase 1